MIRLRCNIQRSLRNSQSLLKMLCLQAPHSDHRHSQADGEMGGALLRALLQRERSSHLSTRRHRASAHHGGVGCYTNTGRTRQGYRELNLRQSSWEWWHPPDLIRHCNTTLLQPLHETLCQCWSEGGVPSTRRKERLQQLQRHLPLEHRGQTVCQIPVSTSLTAGGRVYPESQYGFRAERSTVDMILPLRQL